MAIRSITYQERIAQSSEIGTTGQDKSLHSAIVGRLLRSPNDVARALFNSESSLRVKPIPISDAYIAERSRAICKQFGLKSVAIEGDTTLSPQVYLEKLECLASDLRISSRMLGIVDSSFGAGKLDIKVASNESPLLKGSRDAYLHWADTASGSQEVSITYTQNSDRHRILNHEYAHFIDFQLGMKALGEDRLNCGVFSELPPAIQERIPEAKKAIESIFSLLEGDESLIDEASKLLKNANKNLVLQVIGKEKYFSVSTAELKDLTRIITEDNLFVSLAAREIQKSPQWRENTLSQIVTHSRASSIRSGLGNIDMIESVAGITGLSAETIQSNYIRAIDTLLPEIRGLVPFFSQMNRYVTSPGKMISDSALMNVENPSENQERYWTQPTEVFARMIGRAEGRWAAAKESIFSPHHGKVYQHDDLAVLNANFTRLAKAAGLVATPEGASLGEKHEDKAEVLLRAALLAKTKSKAVAWNAAKVTDNVGARFVSLFADRETRKLSSRQKII